VDLLRDLSRPVLILVGHFGSGKTEIAVNLALALAAAPPGAEAPPAPVNLVDLDLVKPYFRCRLARDAVTPRGVRLVAPDGELSYADLPILLPEIAGLLGQPGQRSVLDVGGDDSGARVLGALGDAIPADRHELLLVVNARRPSTYDLESTLQVLGEIEGAARLRVTGLISNTHLMGETTAAEVAEGLALCRAVAERSGRPVRFACAEAPLAATLPELGVPLLPLRRYILPPFLARPMRTRLAV
jgi:hypothetical protein